MSDSEDSFSFESLSDSQLDKPIEVTKPPNKKPKKAVPKKKVKVNNREPPARHWCFTWNDYDDDTFPMLDDFAIEYCHYMVYQQEKGEENQRDHLQGYFELKVKKRKGTIVNLLHQNIHLEKRRGTRIAARNYCMKEETRLGLSEPIEHGTFSKVSGEQGKRNDINTAVQLAKDNASTDAFVEQIPGTYVRYSKGIKKGDRTNRPVLFLFGTFSSNFSISFFYTGINVIRSHFSKKRDFITTCFVFYGDSRTGKSRLAHTFPDVYKVPVSYGNGPAWFDGYDPHSHRTVLFDDFYGTLKWTELMQIMDRYGHQVHTKGGFVNFRPEFIIFTSNKSPEQWYPKLCTNLQMWPAFKNRVHCQIKFIKHQQGVQLLWQKGDPDDFPEGCQIPISVDPPMELQQPYTPVHTPPLVSRIPKPKPLLRRRLTDRGWVDEPITLENYNNGDRLDPIQEE